MGFFSDLFGGTDTSSQDATIAANAANTALFGRLADQARSDVINLFGPAQQAQQQGVQGALNVLGQTIPQQANLFQQGNIGAQRALTGSLAAQNSAILGLPQDLSGQALGSLITPFDLDLSFAQQQLPDFGGFDFTNLLGTPGGSGATNAFPSQKPLEFSPNFLGSEPDITQGRPFLPQDDIPIDSIINSIFSQNLSVEQKALAVLREAKARGLSAADLASTSSLTAEDIAEGQRLTNFNL